MGEGVSQIFDVLGRLLKQRKMPTTTIENSLPLASKGKSLDCCK
jgi:hypothetical protein